MSEWKEVSLGDITAHSAFGPRFRGEAYSKDGNIATLRTTDIRENGRIEYSSMPIAQLSLEKFANHLLQKDDVVITRTGRVGTTALFDKHKLPVLPGAFLIRFRLKTDVVLPKYLVYFLNSIEGQALVTATATGSVQQNLNATALSGIKFSLPEYFEQKCIAETLSSLDDKIDLLHRQNKTLEALAETLFRQWFVEEADGSWEIGTLDDVISVKGGTTPSTTKPEFWDGNIHWTSPRDLSNNQFIYLFDTERKITEQGLKQIGSGVLPIGTVLLSSRAPIGYLAITEIPVAINQGYIAIRCDKLVSNHFIYLWCKANMTDIENAGNGSVFQEISKSTFRTLEIKIPPKEKLNDFEEQIAPLFQKIKSNSEQIKTLTQLRDTLLPKLMSGEVKVNEI